MNETPEPASLPWLRRFEAAADGPGRYDILVGLPDGYERTDARFPVVYVTDGQLFFWQVVGISRFLALTGFPPVVVVGVGYPEDEGRAGWYGRRNFDFTPGPWEMDDESDFVARYLRASFDALKRTEGRPGLEIKGGGADRFLGFLRDELHPSIRSQFRLDGSRPTLIGDSSGGCFALTALLAEGSPFGGYIAISPTVALANRKLYELEAAYAARHDDLDARLYLAAGSEEHRSATNARFEFVGGVARLTERLTAREYPSFRISSHILAGETHFTIAPRALTHGLLFVFDRPGLST